MQAQRPVRRRQGTRHLHQNVPELGEQLDGVQEEKERPDHQVERGSVDDYLDQDMASSDSGSVFEAEEMDGPPGG